MTLEKDIIDEAKKYADNRGMSLSEIVSNYFKHLTKDEPREKLTELTPRVSRLKGIIEVDRDFDYKKVLEAEKLKLT